MKHDHNLKVCRRCGEDVRSELLRRRCKAPMTSAAKRLWLRRVGRPEELFQLRVCNLCAKAFFRLIVDTRKLCYVC